MMCVFAILFCYYINTLWVYDVLLEPSCAYIINECIAHVFINIICIATVGMVLQTGSTSKIEDF